MKQDKINMDFPTTDEEMREFLESSQPIKVPEKYKTLDWLFKDKDFRPNLYRLTFCK